MKRIPGIIAMAAAVLLATVGQAQGPQQVFQQPGSEGPQELIRVVAVEGTDTGADSLTVANSLRGLRPLLSRLDHDTFTEVAQREAMAPYGGEAILPINSTYRLIVTPLGATEDGVIRFESRVEQRTDAGIVNALRTQGEAVPGQALVYRGLNGPAGGELSLIMSFVRPPSDDASDAEPGDGDPDQEPEPEQQEQPADPDETEGEDEQPPPTPEEGESEGEELPDDFEPEPDTGDDDREPRELDNIEAILESLEEMDNREQEEMRNRRTGVPLRGDWW